jgi:hypothetical protein
MKYWRHLNESGGGEEISVKTKKSPSMKKISLA